MHTNNTFGYIRILFAGLSLMILAGKADAQIKIGTNGNIISPASILELEATNQGLLLPRLADTAAINALNPPNGMLIYLTKAPSVGLYVRKVGFWEWLTGASTTSFITEDNATVTAVFPNFTTGTNGQFGLRTSSTKLRYVPQSGILTATGFTSTVATGTPPFVVASSSTVLNLSATNSTNINVVTDNNTPTPVYPTFVGFTVPNYYGAKVSNSLSYIPNTGILTATGFNGALTGTFTSTVPTGAAPFTVASTTTVPNLSATNSANVFVTNDPTNTATVYPTFAAAFGSNQGIRTADNKLSFVPSSGILTATGFNGTLTGNFISTAATGTAPFTVSSTTPVLNLSATNSTNINATVDNTTASAVFPTFVSSTATGYYGARTNSGLTFIPSSGTLTAPFFNGSLTGNFTSTIATGTAPFTVSSTTPVLNLSATNSTNVVINDDTNTNAIMYPTFVPAIAGNQGIKTSNSKLTFNPNSGVLFSTSFAGLGTGLTGSAAGLNTGTATALQTARNINGVAFDGTANITVAAAAGTLTGNTMAANVITSSLTTVGTIANGIWNAGSVSTTQLRGRLGSPAIINGAGAGAVPQVLITGTDLAGVITVVVNNVGPTGPIATVTYNSTFPTGSYPVLYPANAATAAISVFNQIFATGNTTSFTVSSGSNTLAVGTYSWNYHVIGN